MKILSIAIGLLVGWAVHDWQPSLFAVMIKANGASTTFSGLAVIFTAVWGYVLNRLTVFEKLDDLNADQKDIVIAKVSVFRRLVFGSMISNTVVLAISLLLIFIASINYFDDRIFTYAGYWVCGALTFLSCSFIQSWRCYYAVENSRLAMADIQALNKKKDEYLKKMREDDKKHPIDFSDAHLAAYTNSKL